MNRLRTVELDMNLDFTVERKKRLSYADVEAKGYSESEAKNGEVPRNLDRTSDLSMTYNNYSRTLFQLSYSGTRSCDLLTTLQTQLNSAERQPETQIPTNSHWAVVNLAG